MVFIGGRIPALGGDFNIMFYNIVKKIFKFILALSFVVMGFGLANMAIYCQKSKSIGLRHSFMKALVMTLGEYNLDELGWNEGGVQDDKKGKTFAFTDDDKIMQTFAFIILLCTIIFGSLTIINLFVAVLVSDIKALREEGFLQVVSSSVLTSFSQFTSQAQRKSWISF